MTPAPNTANDNSAATITEPHKQACRCWQGLKRSLVACQTCQWFDRALARIGGDYVAN